MDEYLKLATAIGDLDMCIKLIEYQEYISRMHKEIELWFPSATAQLRKTEVVGEVESVNFHGYTLTREGKIFNPRMKEVGYMRPDGYVQATLSINGQAKTRLVHTWIAEVFIPNPEGLAEVGHKDDNRSNNHVDNLEWVNRMDNEKQCVAGGRKRKSHGGLFTDEELSLIWSMHKAGATNVDIANAYSRAPHQISRFLNGHTYPHFKRS